METIEERVNQALTSLAVGTITIEEAECKIYSIIQEESNKAYDDGANAAATDILNSI